MSAASQNGAGKKSLTEAFIIHHSPTVETMSIILRPALRRAAVLTAGRLPSHSRLATHASASSLAQAPPTDRTLNFAIAAKSLSTKADYQKKSMTEEDLADHSWSVLSFIILCLWLDVIESISHPCTAAPLLQAPDQPCVERGRAQR